MTLPSAGSSATRTAKPRGPDEHANTIGYGIIALTFLRADLR